MKTYISVYLGSAFLALVITPVVIWLARRLSIADFPDLRYVRSKAVSHIGGVAIFLSTMSIVVCVLLLSNVIGQAFRTIQIKVIVLLSAAAFMFFVGLIDDIRTKGLLARIKFLAQMVAAIAVCAVGIRIRSMDVADWLTLDFGWFSWPLTILWIVGITNAVNLSDGLDGLAAGISVVACGVIVVFAVYIGQTVLAVLMLAMLGSLTGFLFFNFNPAKIFMGDCGSMFLGFTIASSSVLCLTKSSGLVGLALPVLALGIPIFDTIFSMLRRSLDRRSMFIPDRNHFHHRLIDLGLKQRHVVIIIYLMTLLSAGVGIIMIFSRDNISLLVFFCIILLMLLVFSIVGSIDFRETIRGLKKKYITSYQIQEEIRNVEEKAELNFWRATNFNEWWHAISKAADLLEFSRVAIGQKGPAKKNLTRIWRRRGLRLETREFLRFGMPIRDPYTTGRTFDLEIEVPIEGSLEIINSRTNMFRRLVEEHSLRHEKSHPDLRPIGEDLSFLSCISHLTSVFLTFDDSIPDWKIEKIFAEVGEDVEARLVTSHLLDNKGSN